MAIQAFLTTSLIPYPAWEFPDENGAGALAEFYGIVRGLENGMPIDGLTYEAYPAMAVAEMKRILDGLVLERPLLSARVIHRHGPVAVGETAIYVGIRAAHRAEAFDALRKFMDQLKQDVPIWKSGPIESATTELPGMGSVSDVIAILDRVCNQLPPRAVSLGQAAGQVLAGSVYADADQPAFDRSSIDGFAVLANSGVGVVEILGEILPGDPAPSKPPAGFSWRIYTGAEVPDGCGLVMIEDTRPAENGGIFLQKPASNRLIRRKGSSVKKGAEILSAGERIGPGEVAVLASVGVSWPEVVPSARILHVTTGREIVPPHQVPLPGQIRDSNGPLVQSLGLQAGAHLLPTRHSDESVEELVAAVEAADDWDILLVSGGSSVGAHDRTPEALETLGFEILSRRVNARPGKPLLIARRGRQLAFGLPGNPVSHFVTFHVFVQRAIALLSGRKAREWVRLRLGVGTSLRRDSRETFWPAKLRMVDGMATAIPLPWLDSGDLAALRGVEALIRIPADAEPPPPGCLMDVLFCSSDLDFTTGRQSGIVD